ncbi:adenosylcobinamide-phosphate synthase CbiB [Methylocella tundrae]|uniref:adenosylcobinamide-phosphate synthase CbiB n=1 Tax=Methylocella tundrae TaxID=227605 RepID=UPI0030FE0BB8|nr:adenosylcobinamide-phosphate synthase CbiB [Methylocella tundrae]
MGFTAHFELAVLAVAIEAVVGYPPALYAALGHPVSWIGALISYCDRRLNREDRSFAERRILGAAALGFILAAAGGAAFVISSLIVHLALPNSIALCLLALIASSLIAQRSLHSHVRAVALALEHRGLEAGRAAVAAIVGRNVSALDAAGVARAAIESLAENFSDGIVAPAFWLAAGGLPGGVCYKAINTADSMIGHLTPRHAAFGYAAAKLDDVANFFPARLSVLWIAVAAMFLKGAGAGGAWRTALRDGRGHPSPNAGWPEAAFAGALGLKLGGPRRYGDEEIADAWIGSGESAATSRDIFRALALYRRACLVHWGVLALAALLFIARG